MIAIFKFHSIYFKLSIVIFIFIELRYLKTERKNGFEIFAQTFDELQLTHIDDFRAIFYSKFS